MNSISSNRVNDLFNIAIPLDNGQSLSVCNERSTNITHKRSIVMISGRCITEGPYYNKRIKLHFFNVNKPQRRRLHKWLNNNDEESLETFLKLEENKNM